jgi:hypothetical protein
MERQAGVEIGDGEANNSFHMPLVKIGSRLVTIDDGIPWRRTMLSKKALPTIAAEYGCPRE